MNYRTQIALPIGIALVALVAVSISARPHAAVYQQRAFITQLPPGEYLSFWLSTSPDFADTTATVRLVIAPAGVAH